MRTAFTEIVGVEYPISCGGMTGVGNAELTAAVAEAGALGFLTALNQPTPEQFGEEIDRTRTLTNKPFGVNLTMLPTIVPVPYEKYVQVILDKGISVVETAGSNPAPLMPLFKEAGIKVVHKATSVRHALHAEKIGVDVVSIDGYECAGHPGSHDVGGLVLIPAAVRALEIPVIGSGGFADGRGLAAALTLGATGVNMGTRFLCTVEARVHSNVKQQIVENNETDTVIVFGKFHNAARVARNEISEEIAEIESRPGTTFDDIAHLASGKRGRERVYTQGDMSDGLWWASQAQGLIHEVLTVEQVVTSIIHDAKKILGNVSSYAEAR